MKNFLLLIAFCSSISFLSAQESEYKNVFSANPVPLFSIVGLNINEPISYFEYKRKIKKGYFRIGVNNRLTLENLDNNFSGLPVRIVATDSTLKIGTFKEQTSDFLLRIGNERHFSLASFPKFYFKISYDVIFGRKTIYDANYYQTYKKVNGAYELQNTSGDGDYTNTKSGDFFTAGLSAGTGCGYRISKHIDLSLNVFINGMYLKSNMSGIKNTTNISMNILPAVSLSF